MRHHRASLLFVFSFPFFSFSSFAYPGKTTPSAGLSSVRRNRKTRLVRFHCGKGTRRYPMIVAVWGPSVTRVGRGSANSIVSGVNSSSSLRATSSGRISVTLSRGLLALRHLAHGLNAEHIVAREDPEPMWRAARVEHSGPRQLSNTFGGQIQEMRSISAGEQVSARVHV